MSDHDSATSSREAPKTTWKHPSELRIRTEEQLKCYTKAALFDHLQNLYPLVDEAEAERASIAHVHTLQREVDDLRRQLADKEALIISKDEVIALSKEKAALLSIHIQSLDRQQQHYAVETERERSQPHVDLHTQSPVADDDGDDQHIDEYNPQQAGYRSITHSTQHLSDDMGRLSATRQSDRRDGPAAQPDSSTARELNAQSTHPMAPGLEYLADALRQQTELAKRQADIAQMRPLPPFTGSESEESFETWLQRFEQRAERLDLPPSARLFHLQ
uniref:Uncharacterized protein n=1 Tax=Plectus sambesii TaxID=2011161 RepID=A0A914XG92_9BILA